MCFLIFLASPTVLGSTLQPESGLGFLRNAPARISWIKPACFQVLFWCYVDLLHKKLCDTPCDESHRNTGIPQTIPKMTPILAEQERSASDPRTRRGGKGGDETVLVR